MQNNNYSTAGLYNIYNYNTCITDSIFNKNNNFTESLNIVTDSDNNRIIPDTLECKNESPFLFNDSNLIYSPKNNKCFEEQNKNIILDRCDPGNFKQKFVYDEHDHYIRSLNNTKKCIKVDANSNTANLGIDNCENDFNNKFKISKVDSGFQENFSSLNNNDSYIYLTIIILLMLVLLVIIY